MQADFEKVFDFTVGAEGGFTKDPNDPGNWTGGRIGRGKLNGTKFGISASAYPHVNIAGVTIAFAKHIYLHDYWLRTRCDILPGGLDLVAFDGAVNSGVQESSRFIQIACGAVPDGVIGPKTLAAITGQPVPDLINRACNARLAFLQRLTGWQRYGKGWGHRVERLRQTALSLA